MEEFDVSFKYQTELLKYTIVDDLNVKYVIPERSLLFIPLLHAPKAQIVKKFDVSF